MEWQPIETAPKETDVLCFIGNGRFIVAGKFNRGWLVYDDPFGDPYYPSHWMPLPEPPQDFSGDIGHE